MCLAAKNALVAAQPKKSRPTHIFQSEFAKCNDGGATQSPVIKFSNCSNGGVDFPKASLPAEKAFWPLSEFNLTGLDLLRSTLSERPSTENTENRQIIKMEELKPIDVGPKFQHRLLSACERFADGKNSVEHRSPILVSHKREHLQHSRSSTPDVIDSKTPKTQISSISCLDLIKLMCLPEHCAILDCRSFMAFNANHICGALNVTIANKLIRKRLVDGLVTIHDLVSGTEGKAEYKRKETTAVIVVYDDNTTDLAALPAGHPLKLLCNRLQSENRDVKFLEGGLQAFQKSYNNYCRYPDAPPTQPMLYSPTSQDVDAAVDNATASQIVDYLYVGNERDASNKETLEQLGITHILNVTAHIPFNFEDRLTCKRLQASDSGSQNLKQYFGEAISFIEEARLANGRVLIHCQAGVSRSPTIAMAYIMARFGKSLQEAFSHLHSRRSIISPNLNFMGQLLEFGLRTDLADFCLSPPPNNFPESGKD